MEDITELVEQLVLHTRGLDVSIYVLTDLSFKSKYEFVHRQSLKQFTLRGWWSKLEIFQFTGACLYFDLDTVILGSLHPLVDGILNGGENKFYGMKAFNPGQIFTTGIMGWNGDFSFLLKKTDSLSRLFYKLDQLYIYDMLLEHKHTPEYVNKFIDGIVSYKNHCSKGVPKKTKIVCFHGKPRPSEITDSYLRSYRSK